MKRQIIPGDNVSFKTSKYENESIIEWLNSQSNITDSIRYLIEQDIEQYGVRNLQEHVPARRSVSVNRNTIAQAQRQRQELQKPEIQKQRHDAQNEEIQKIERKSIIEKPSPSLSQSQQNEDNPLIEIYKKHVSDSNAVKKSDSNNKDKDENIDEDDKASDSDVDFWGGV